MRSQKELERDLHKAYLLKKRMYEYYDKMSIFQDKRGFYGQIEEVLGIIDGLYTAIYNKPIEWERFEKQIR